MKLLPDSCMFTLFDNLLKSSRNEFSNNIVYIQIKDKLRFGPVGIQLDLQLFTPIGDLLYSEVK